MDQHQQEHRQAIAGEDVAADAATLNSDAAVADGMGALIPAAIPVPTAAAVPVPAASSLGTRTPDGGGNNRHHGSSLRRHVNSHARRRHYRKRALSAAGNSLGGTFDAIRDSNNANGLASFTINSSAMGSQMGGGAENSIVSFGLNFNFDGASSPSASDSGGGGKGGVDAGSSGEDDNNNNVVNGNGNGNVNVNVNCKASRKIDGVSPATKGKKATGEDKKKVCKAPSTPAKGGGGKGKDGGGSGKKHASVKFGPNCTTGANAVAASADAAVAAANAVAATAATDAAGASGSSTASSGSDSSQTGDDMNNEDSGGSASGGRSMVSSLTTSSNQGWMATNESAVAAAEAEGAAVAGAPGGDKAVGKDQVADGNAVATKKTDPLRGKKRKQAPKATGGNGGENNAGGNGNGEEHDGYKTDEEQWGGNRDNGDKNEHTPSPAVFVHNSALRASSKKSPDNAGGPRMKQARFSMDHHPSAHRRPGEHHPENVLGADASAQPLSSLSGSDSAGGGGGRGPATVMSLVGGRTALGPLAPLGAAVVGTTTPSLAPPNPLILTPGCIPASYPGAGPRLPEDAALASAPAEPNKRKERNAREKERSCRIARQIDDLRALLSRGGVIVSKGTKSLVLSEAANYINLLQQQQAQWEMDKQALMQQMQQIGAAANTVGHNPPSQNDMSVGGAAPNGMDAQAAPQQFQQQGGIQGQQGGGMQQQQQQQLPQNQNAISPNDYKFIFENSSVGMAIASLGGAFVDCNPIFCQLSKYTKEEVCAMTIFNVTSRQDLQHAFDLISQMITPTLDSNNNNKAGGVINGSPSINGGGGINSSPSAFDKEDDKSSIVLRGAMKSQSDLGLSISLIKGDQGIAKCFCVTLVRILSMERTRSDTVAIEMELPQVWSTKQQKHVGFGATPAYTSG